MLNPIEEAKHAKLREMCRELRVPPPPEIYIGLKVVDLNGVLVFDDKQRGHSWTRNFWNLMFALATCSNNSSGTFGAGYISGKTKGALVFGGPTIAQHQFNNSTGFINTSANADAGIVLGTSDSAFSPEAYDLGATIAHGTGSGQLSYNGMNAQGCSYDSGTKVWTAALQRVFNNNGTGSVTVKEAGLLFAGLLWSWNKGGATPWLMERTVLDPSVAVPVGAQLTVTYELSMNFSAIDS